MDLIANIEPAVGLSAEANVVPNLQINVVQTTGTSTTDVMSQNAVSVELAARRTTAAQDVIDNAQTARIDDIIEKLKGNVYKTQDGASPAYIQSVPANSQAYSALGMIGGKTVAWNQLEYGQTTVLNGSTTSGVTFTTENGYTKLNGTASAYITNCYFDRTTLEQNTVGGHKYFLWGCSKNSGTYYLEPLVGSGGDFCYGHPHERGDGVIFESKKTDGTLTFLYGIRLEIGAGSTFSNTRINCYLADLTKMFGSGNEPTSLTDSRISFIKAYASANPSYNAGTLLSAKTDAVKSVDSENNVVDSFPIPSAVKSLAGYGQSAGSVYNYVDVETKTYRNMIGLKLKDLTWVEYQDGIYHTDPLAHAQINSFPLCPNYFSYNNLSSVLDIDKSACIAGSNDLWIHDSSYTDATAFKNHFGDNEYVHFEASDNTGTDYEARIFHKRVGEVDLGSLDYAYHSGLGVFYSRISGATTTSNATSIVCPIYVTAIRGAQSTTDKSISINNSYYGFDNGMIGIRDSSYTDPTAFKTAMAGVKLQYELATEQILDVTSYFSGDVFIEVENGGTVEFHQEGNVQLEIPNRNTYLVDVFGGY